MKKLLIGSVAAILLTASPALAHKGHHHAKGGHHGAATPKTVKLDGVEVPVCTAKGQDKCVNPREAGLHFGNVAAKDYNKK